jgi:Plastocyanin
MKKKHSVESKKTALRNIINSKLFLFIIFVLSLSIPFIFQGESEYEVVISDSGFNPKEIIIPKGATVIWKIEGKNYHWPASDNHPTHTIYPEGGGCLGSKLDACSAMKKGESYSFRFDKEGSWEMHDHIDPRLTMTIIVESGKKNFTDYKNETNIKHYFLRRSGRPLKKFQPI